MRLGESLLSAIADSLSKELRQKEGKKAGRREKREGGRCLWGDPGPKAHVPG